MAHAASAVLRSEEAELGDPIMMVMVMVSRERMCRNVCCCGYFRRVMNGGFFDENELLKKWRWHQGGIPNNKKYVARVETTGNPHCTV
jgi:hypothetical protein